MALSLTSGNRDRIALLVYGVLYTNLDTEQKTLLDEAGTVPDTTPGGIAGDAFKRVAQMTQYLAQAGTASPPDESEPWFVVEAAYLLALNARPERAQILKQSRDMAERMFVESYTAKAITYDETADSSAFYPSIANLRKGIIAACVRRNPAFYPAVDDVDASIYWAMNRFWNSKKWNFRRRQVSMSISTASAVTFDLATTEAFDSISTRRFYYTDSSSQGRVPLEWADADEAARLQAAVDGGMTDGRPQRFRVERQGTSRVWTFFPNPDTAYTARGEVIIAGPAAVGTSTASFSTYIGLIPTELHPILRQLALGKLLMNAAQPGGADVLRMGEDEMDRLAPDYEDHGDADVDTSVRDVYGDVLYQRGTDHIGGSL